MNQKLCLGRKRAIAFGPRIRLSNYMAQLPAFPAECDYSAKAQTVLSDIYGNDELGDCVIAGGYHIVGVATGNAGKAFHATQKQIIADYSAIGGYVPGDPSTDQGCNEETALNYWQNKGFADGTKLLGWLALDGTNPDELKAAMYLFENLMFGIELPNAWINPFPSRDGFIWDVAGKAIPENGHAVIGTGFNDKGVSICSWGMKGTLTWNAIKKYCSRTNYGEVYALLTPDQLAKGQVIAPNGIDWKTLIMDFDAMGGNVPLPPDPVPPSPVPPLPPVAEPTLAEVQLWLQSSFSHAHSTLTRNQALTLALKAVAQNWPVTK